MSVIKEWIKEILIPTLSFLLKMTGKKNVVLVVQHGIMFHYIRPVLELLREDKRIRPWICFVWPELMKEGERETIIKKYRLLTIWYRIAKHLSWDLVIFPDHNPVFYADCPKIRIEHGFYSGKKVKGNKYLYGPNCLDEQGNIIYQKFLVSSEYIKDGVKQYYPQFYPRLRVVGSMLLDEISRYASDREQVFEELSLDKDRKIVMVVSTWGPKSFIQKQGLEFLKRVPAIAQKYNIIISIHSFNYVERLSGGQNWKELLDSVKTPNVYIAEPAVETYRILANADLLVTDATSLGMYFPIFGRPIVHFDDPEIDYEELSLNKELRKVSYPIDDVLNIEEDIDKAFDSFDRAKMLELSEKIASCQGSARDRFREEIYETLSLEKQPWLK